MLYVFVFSLNYEMMDLFGLGIPYLTTKITISVLLLASMIDGSEYFSIARWKEYTFPLLAYFVLLASVNIMNTGDGNTPWFELEFFLNILIFIVMLNYSSHEPQILLRSLVVFAISGMVLTLLFYLGLGTSSPLEGRFAMFGGNANDAGLKVCIALLILVVIIWDNPLQMSGKRYGLLIAVPFMLGFLVATGSRVGFLSFVSGVFVFLYLRFSGRKTRKVPLVLGAFAAGIVIWWFALRDSFLFQRLIATAESGDVSARDMLWTTIMDISGENVLWGIGKTGYMQKIDLLFKGFVSPHNVLLEILIYTGVVGIIVFGVFLYRVLRTAYQHVDRGTRSLPLMMSMPLLGTILSGQLLEHKLYWFLMAFIVSRWQIDKQWQRKGVHNVLDSAR